MTQKSYKISHFDAVLYKNENNTWFSSVLPCMYYHILIVVYDSKYGTTRALFAKYIHGKTDDNHVLFSNYWEYDYQVYQSKS